MEERQLKEGQALCNDRDKKRKDIHLDLLPCFSLTFNSLKEDKIEKSLIKVMLK